MNYYPYFYDKYHQKNVTQPMIGSETSSDVSDRGVYANDVDGAYVSAYDVNYPPWGQSAEDGWCPILEKSFMSGAFIWTGFDYKGEPTPYKWPNINSHFGIIDICGFPKDNFYYYQSVWLPKDKPMLHLFPHWNWNQMECVPPHCRTTEDGTNEVDVWAYTNGDTAELFLDGESLGNQTVATCRHANWTVPYTPGKLSVKSYRNGVLWGAEVGVGTTGEPKGLAMEVEFPAGPVVPGEVALVTVRIIDSNGMTVPTASSSSPISFSLQGSGTIIGLGNGDPSSHESDKPTTPTSGERSVWNGLARVVLQAGNDDMVLTAVGDGLGQARLTVEVR